MAEIHKIILDWDEKTDLIAVRGLPDDVVEIGDTILFELSKPDRGKAFVVFKTGSPFSADSFAVFTDTDTPIVAEDGNKNRSHFDCFVVAREDGLVHGKGDGGETPKIKTSTSP
jgi:hypothetical protein